MVLKTLANLAKYRLWGANTAAHLKRAHHCRGRVALQPIVNMKSTADTDTDTDHDAAVTGQKPFTGPPTRCMDQGRTVLQHTNVPTHNTTNPLALRLPHMTWALPLQRLPPVFLLPHRTTPTANTAAAQAHLCRTKKAAAPG